MSFIGQIEKHHREHEERGHAAARRTELAGGNPAGWDSQDQVLQAQVVVSQVNAQITSVQNRISDHDSFFGQFSDFIGGIANVGEGAPSWFTTPVGASVEAEAGIGSTSSADTAGLLGLGAGASVMAGFRRAFLRRGLHEHVKHGGRAETRGRASSVRSRRRRSRALRLSSTSRSGPSR